MLIDTHCHLTSPELLTQVDDVLAAARVAGVTRLILVATNPTDAHTAAALLVGRSGLYMAAGIHPHEAATADSERLAALASVLRGHGLAEEIRPRLVALGETGLDFHYDFAPRATQEQVFELHLALAEELRLPVIIHARKSEERVCEILAGHPALHGRVVFHCFSGGPELARRVLDLGCVCSFTGVVTFKKAAEIQAAARYVPADRLMIETDAPYMSPEPHRSIRPNVPALLVHTAQFLAKLRGERYEDFAAATTANAIRFFNLTKDAA